MSGTAQKLTHEAVNDIRARLAAGEKQRYVAAVYGVSQPTIWAIGNNKLWKHGEPFTVEVPEDGK